MAELTLRERQLLWTLGDRTRSVEPGGFYKALLRVTFARVEAELAPNWLCALISGGPHGYRLQLQRRSDEEYMLPGGLRCVEAETLEAVILAAKELTHAVGENWLEEA